MNAHFTHACCANLVLLVSRFEVYLCSFMSTVRGTLLKKIEKLKPLSPVDLVSNFPDKNSWYVTASKVHLSATWRGPPTPHYH